MTPRTDTRSLQRRREDLLSRSAMLRARLRHEAAAFETPLQLADQGLQGLHWLRTHPEWPLAALGVWVLLGPRRALRWASRGWWLWRGLRRVAAWSAAGGGWTRPR